MANKIFTNTVWQVAIRAISVLVGVANLGLITRILGQTNFGFYTTIFAFAQMFMVLVDLGLYLTLLREVSSVDGRQEESRVTNNIFTIRFVSSLTFLALAPLAIQLFPYAPEVKTHLIYFIVAFFFQTLITTLSAIFAKKLAMPKIAIADLVGKVFYLGLLAYLFFYNGSLKAVLFSNSVTQFLAFILIYLFLRKYIDLRFAWDFKFWKTIIYRTLPLALSVVLNLIYFKADTLVLAAFVSPEEVALYGAPYRILEVLVTFPHMFLALILPILTAAWLKKNVVKFREIWQNSFDFFVILTPAILITIWLIGRPLITTIAGADFAASGAILNVLVLATVAIYFGTLLIYVVVALSLQKEMIKYFLLTAAFGLTGYFIFIPRFSYWGAAWMTVATEILIGVCAYLVIRKKLSLQTDFKIVWKSGEAALAALLVGWLLHNTHPIIMVLGALLVYVALMYFSKAINKQKLQALLKRTD
jgi:O-antigen/teichoic acid export membrane protein